MNLSQAKVDTFFILIHDVPYHLTHAHKTNKHENGGNAVYLLLLDAAKAFDKVSYKVLFDVLLDKIVRPRIVNLLYYMYRNQQCHVKWEGCSFR